MDYKNDNRTPRDRITGEFLSELLFTDLGGDCNCDERSMKANARVLPGRRVVCNRSDSRTVPNTDNRSSCIRNSVELTGDYSLAMAYVPMQKFGELFDIETGFCEGTIFKELRFPFYPTPCRKEND